MKIKDSVKAEMKQFIIENYLPSSGLDYLNDEDSFIENGIIDSTGTLELLEYIEDTFNIQIKDEEVNPDNFSSLIGLTSFIKTKLINAN